MWFLTLFPAGVETWLVHAILIAGIILMILGTFTDKIPGVAQYTILVKLVGLICLVGGVYCEGAVSADTKYKDKITAMQKQADELKQEVADAQVKSTSVNTDITDTIQKQIASVKASQVSIQNHIDQVAKKIDAQCVVDPEAISILNNAARSQK